MDILTLCGDINKHNLGIYILHHGLQDPDPDFGKVSGEPRCDSYLCTLHGIASPNNRLESQNEDGGVEVEHEA